ncbi:Uncharacterised protein [Zhongshania aliphaticivorans]|uniref:Alpha/beta hydrolase n=1 Tax=Zhongshania aliphaticivorans TaxID=1470434 RepID=A0A5S9NEL4_9GAMM|nr:hypothetical protein [Zhongshania aliphaticivorans]CAA0088225.1 Uncharacterised protein [Zhongshania aliphaticivorans]CAA0116180.1 Uncharacterised protein [Zhongshania aliphaticivorans]CAA0120380.1 Uncharacterised protein [Zhongshania aliphaticivorans]
MNDRSRILGHALWWQLTWPVIAAGIVVLLSACSSPSQRIYKMASGYGMEQLTIRGNPFQHVAYLKMAQVESQRLHVYIEGDGRPWLYGREIAEDPTSLKPLALTLANLDAENVLYLGRPCYMGFANSGVCEKKYWTSARYAAEVVASMSTALKAVLDELDVKSVHLIGYSGGGSLAMLMATEPFLSAVPSIEKVVTIAANLNVDAWTQHHNYLPLNESLDPSLQTYPNTVSFLHYAGSADKNIPASQLLDFVAEQGGSHKILADVDHNCCWAQRWPMLLPQVSIPISGQAQ